MTHTNSTPPARAYRLKAGFDLTQHGLWPVQEGDWAIAELSDDDARELCLVRLPSGGLAVVGPIVGRITGALVDFDAPGRGSP